jgi:hypothetical protein
MIRVPGPGASPDESTCEPDVTGSFPHRENSISGNSGPELRHQSTAESAVANAQQVLDRPATSLVVVTPSYGPDLGRFRELHGSVLRHLPEESVHVVIVPTRDVAAFRQFQGPRCTVISEPEVLGRSIVRLPGTKFSVNLRRPLPPVRGWILQQVLKLGVARLLSEDVMVMVDSDVLFIRDASINDFTLDGRAIFYRLPDAISPEELPRHATWAQTSRSMLGLRAQPPPYPDYVSSLSVWDRRLVLELLRRVEEVSGRRWDVEVGRQLHFSEWTLYGTFVDHVSGGHHPAETSTMRCLTYWDEVPLGYDEAYRYFAGTSDQDLAVMLSAKSGTPEGTRTAVFRDLGLLPSEGA